MSEYDDLIEGGDAVPASEVDDPGSLPAGTVIEGTPEELAEVAKRAAAPTLGEDFASSLPPLMRASDLLPKEEGPLERVPVEPPDEDTPPDDALPTFLVRRNRYGPGAHSVLLANGEPVGQWLDRAHHELDGAGVASLLAEMGLEEDLVEQFARRRDDRLAATSVVAGMPMIKEAVALEESRLADKAKIQEAFVKAQKKKSE